LEFIWTRSLCCRRQSHRHGFVSRCLRRAPLVLALLVAAAALAPTAEAALEPGTPIAVAPGVPGQGRAWELVTSPDPLGALVSQVRGLSASGDRVAYRTGGTLPDAPYNEPFFGSDMAVRGSDGWSNLPAPRPDPYPSVDSFFFPEPQAFDSELESVLWNEELLGTSTEATGLYRGPFAGPQTLLAERVGFAGASADLHHVVFSSSAHLLPADAGRTAGSSVYEVAGSTLRLVDVDDGGALLSDCGASSVGPDGISRDGERIFFSTSPGCAGPAQIFMRSRGTTTTEISASQCDLPDCGPESGPTFLGAAASGSSAFFVSAQRLTDDDTDANPDLYRYDVADGDLTLITSAPGGCDLYPQLAAVQPSLDGSRVYFSAFEVLDSGGLSGFRLYVADATGCHRFPVAPGGFLQVSTDGRYALFATTEKLTAADEDERVDAYRFDAVSGDVTLISIGPDGGAGAFDVSLVPEDEARISLASNPYRAISADGSRIFFSTPESLLSQDRNEVTDVYEWENGALSLVSAGVGKQPSIFLGTTADGKTAIFSTFDTLLPRDRDNGDMDIYSARIGGGFPESVAAVDCSGPACRASSSGRLGRTAPESAGPAQGGIRLGRIGAAARRRIASTGWITLLAEVPAPGRLSAAAQARLGRERRTVAATSVEVAQAGPVRLRMRLSKRARQELAAGRSLRLQLLLRLSGLDSVGRVGFELGGAR
jgi:hypothetical protein